MIVTTQSPTSSASEPITTNQPPHSDTEQPSPPTQSSQASSWVDIIKTTPQFKADATLANRYAAALTSDATTLPIPPGSMFGQWRQHLDALLAGDDFKQWADDNHIDLTKPIRIFPPSDSTQGSIITALKPSAPRNGIAHAGTHTFGARLSDGQSLPASWALIMQASRVLASDGGSVRVPPIGQASLSAHAERPAQLEEVFHFYGETLPQTQEALLQRTNKLKQADALFPQPDATLSPEQLDMRSEGALEQQQRELGDINNYSRLSKLLTTAITPPPPASLEVDQRPYLLALPATPEQAAQREKTLVAHMLESDTFKLTVDPTSWYSQDEQLAPGASVTLKQFITDNGWVVPETKDDLSNLIQAIKRGPLPPAPHGNLSGAAGWTDPLTLDEKKQLYSHVRFNNLNLPDLGAAHAADNNGGAFNYLTKNRHWTSSELNDPRAIVNDILTSPKARELEAALRRKMGVVEDADSADLDLGAIQLGLDEPTRANYSKRNQCADFDLADKRFYGQPLADIKRAFTNHLTDTHRTTSRMAPVAAYMLLSSAAPELLVKGIPADVTYGSPTWFSLKATVAFIEAKSPGSSASMSFAEIIKYAAIDPITAEDLALQNVAKRNTLIDWALVHGTLQPSPTDSYSSAQLDTAQSQFSEIMGALQKNAADTTASVPQLKEMALEELGKRYKNVPFELDALTTPQARTNNALNNDILHTHTGPYSLLDLYVSGQAPSSGQENNWYSLNENALPGSTIEALHTLPTIKSLHRTAVADYQTDRENGLVNLTKHLIAQLPIDDRKQLEYGKLDVFIEGTVIKHRVDTRNGVLNLDQTTPAQDQGKRSLIIRATHEGRAKFYEFCPQQHALKPRNELGSDFTPGPQGQWVEERSEQPSGRKHSNTAITEFSIPQGDTHKLQATTPTGDVVPASYTSPRSQFLGELLSKHTLGTADLDQWVSATSHPTRFDEEDEEIKTNREVLLASTIIVNPIRNVLNGDWLAVASDILFDGVMYVTTAGLGKVANAAKPLSGALKQSGKPFGRRLFTHAANSPANRLNDDFSKLLPGKAEQYSRARFAIRPDIAEGTYKKGITEISTTAKLDKTNGKWFAADSKTGKAYGKPLENFKPQASARIDDALPDASTRAMSPQQRSLDLSLGRDNVIQMGGPMNNLKLIGNEVHTFTDTYKGTTRLNIVAHGLKRNLVERITGDGTKIIMDNTLYDARGLATLLRGRGVDLVNVDNVRLLVCYSGEGRSRAFGRLFQREINKPVKAFEGTVSLTHGSTSVTDIRNGVRSQVSQNFPNAAPAAIEQATDVLTEGLFNGRVTPHIQKNHGQTIRVNIAPPGQAPIHDDLKITYLPRQFNR